MNTNVGSRDRILRLLGAILAVVAALSVGVTSGWGLVLLLIGAVLAITAAVGFCPLYRLLGVSTRPVKAD